jgi:N-methylhydantoinase B
MEKGRLESELDPVTFEVLRNAYVNLVDRMSEQIIRTCYSFVIYNRDFSCCLNDANGDTVTQGTQDIAVHVGTLHYTAKAVLDFYRDDLHPGDVIITNDPYIGGTHFNDVRIMRPVFCDDQLIAVTQTNGHWADVGGPVPGSFNIKAQEFYSEGLRIPPLKIWDRGTYRKDVANMIVSNMRVPEDALGDMRAQAEATRVGEERLFELIEKYGLDTVLTAFAEVQDYVERIMRKRISELPDGTWETEDYIDSDPSSEEGLVKVHVKMTIKGDEVHYDLSGSDPYTGSFLNGGFGSSFSAVIAGTKTFFPDVPLNSGMYRVIHATLPVGTVVNAPAPIACTGFCSGSYEKIMNAIFELWSQVMPERAMACSFNLEYLLVGGKDKRPGYGGKEFMWYDWMAGGWGGRVGKDGANATAPVFGAGLAVQPLEGQERGAPVLTTEHRILTDSGGPGKWRGGCGVAKGGLLAAAERPVMSYCADRERSITWGIQGGLPSIPQGVILNPDSPEERHLGVVFSNVPTRSGDSFTRPSAGGGGYGDPLERDPDRVLEDVIEGYVSVERARKDYGVVIREIDPELCRYEVDLEATRKERGLIREHRKAWLEEDPERVVEMLRKGEIDEMDLYRRYGVIVDRNTQEVLPRTTKVFREMLQRRAARFWK